MAMWVRYTLSARAATYDKRFEMRSIDSAYKRYYSLASAWTLNKPKKNYTHWLDFCVSAVCCLLLLACCLSSLCSVELKIKSFFFYFTIIIWIRNSSHMPRMSSQYSQSQCNTHLVNFIPTLGVLCSQRRMIVKQSFGDFRIGLPHDRDVDGSEILAIAIIRRCTELQ